MAEEPQQQQMKLREKKAEFMTWLLPASSTNGGGGEESGTEWRPGGVRMEGKAPLDEGREASGEGKGDREGGGRRLSGVWRSIPREEAADESIRRAPPFRRQEQRQRPL